MKRLLFTTLVALAPALVAGGVLAQEHDAEGEREMLNRINVLRAEAGHQPLIRSGALDSAAWQHSQEMASLETLTHVSPSSGTPADRVRATGLNADTVAENVALHRSSGEAMQALLGSEAHRGNMLHAEVTHVGLAALRSEAGVYITQIFARLRSGQPSPAAPPPAVQRVQEDDDDEGADEAEELVAPSQAGPSAEGRAPGTMPRGPVTVEPNGVINQRSPDGQRVVGYWVRGQTRWWYYPMPPGAQAGQQLQPDHAVMGPPPGLDQAQAQRVPPPPPQHQAAPHQPRSGVVLSPAQPHGRVIIRPGPGGQYYAPPPPYVGGQTRAMRRSQLRWERRYQRWLRQQERLRRHGY